MRWTLAWPPPGRLRPSCCWPTTPTPTAWGRPCPNGAAPGGWRPLRGDEIGAVLAHHLLAHGGIAPGAVLATTIVSSTLLSKMAAAAGRPFVETLTGFKWLGRAADPDRTLGFAYEEALGFCAGGLVQDKDGITAAVLLAEAVAVLARGGRTVLNVLDRPGPHPRRPPDRPVVGSGLGRRRHGPARRIDAGPPRSRPPSSPVAPSRASTT